MIKKFHYIKEKYSGEIEQTCLSSYKALYPDFEFFAWQPGSSPFKILYDNGGLFVGPGIFAANKLPDIVFEKDFIAFSNVFDSVKINPYICYANEEKSSVFLSIMEQKFKKEVSGNLSNEKNFYFDDINIYNKDQFGYLDIFEKTIPNVTPFFIDMNTQGNYLGEWNVQYLIIDKDSDPDKVYWACESFVNLKEDKHFMLVVLTSEGSVELFNNVSKLLNYHAFKEDKKWDAIIAPINKNEVLLEYLSRRFNKILSIKKAVN